MTAPTTSTSMRVVPTLTGSASPVARRPRARGAIALVRRLLRLIAIVFTVTFANFFLLKAAPGDPVAAALGPDATAEQYEAMQRQMGLTGSPWSQYVEWLAGAVRFDFGMTWTSTPRNVNEELLARLPVTLELIVLAVGLAILLSIPLALLSAYFRGSLFDRALSTVLYAIVSIPGFVSALILVLLLVFHPDLVRTAALVVAIAAPVVAVIMIVRRRRAGRRVKAVLVIAAIIIVVALCIWAFLPAFPRQGFVPLSDGLGANLISVALPVVTLALLDTAIFTRVLRTDLLVELDKPYVLASRARGTSTMHVLFVEVLRPSLFSMLTILGLTVGQLIGGAVIVEQIFRLPGVGSGLTAAVRGGDIPTVQATVVLLAVAYVVINTIVDLTYSSLDPRTRKASQ